MLLHYKIKPATGPKMAGYRFFKHNVKAGNDQSKDFKPFFLFFN